MKRFAAIWLSILLITILLGCNRSTACTTICAPLEFTSLQHFITARNDKKDAGTQQTDLSFDLQQLITVDKFYQINACSELTNVAKITVNYDVLLIHYDYDNPNKEFVETMADPEMQRETLLAVKLIWHRGQGEADFKATLDLNGKNGTLMSIGNYDKVLMFVGYYKEKLIVKTFEFLFNGNYLHLQVPGNVDDSFVSRIFDHIAETPLE